MTDASKMADDDHARGCEGRCYTCTCGYDDRVDAALRERDTLAVELSATTAERNRAHRDCDTLAAENARLREMAGEMARTLADLDRSSIGPKLPCSVGETRLIVAPSVSALRASRATLAKWEAFNAQ